MPRIRFALFALLVILTTGMAALLLIRGGRAPELHGTLLDPALPAAPFSLASGTTVVSPADFRGKVVVLFFGYTACPDVCPLTMHRLAAAVDALGDRADEVQVILVSVDPERDAPEDVDAYAKRFDPSFIGATGSEDELRAVTTAYGIFYAKNAASDAVGYTVDHSASTLVLDRDGGLRMIWPYETSSDDLASDLLYLLRL